MNANNRFLLLSHSNAKHVLKEIASRSKNAFMSFDLSIPNNEGNIGKVFVFKHPQKIFRHLWLRYLDTDGQHPNVIETKFAIVSTKNVKLSFHNISSVSTSWSWLKLTCGNFLPVVTLNIKHMDVIHPVNTVVSSEVNDL